MKNLIFLLGLPRSGTTLLQRVLSAHPDVASVAEPWVLLPLVTCFDPDYTRSVYGQNNLEIAITDLKVEAGNFQHAYDNHVRTFINDIYTPLRGNKRYFLDKTPRYYLIADELHRLFPEAKFIYLFRNPIDIYDSIIETFFGGKLYQLSAHYFDLTEGVNLISKLWKINSSNSLKINYEDFCTNGEDVIRQICKYLEIEYLPEILTQFSQVRFSGRSGDPKQGLLSKVLNSRKVLPISTIRRGLYAKWLEHISELAWEVSGYRRDELFAQLKASPSAGIRQQLDDLRAYISFYNDSKLARVNQKNIRRVNKYGNFFF